MRTTFRLATGVAALATAVAGVALPAQAATHDPAPVGQGTSWLTSQLTNGIVHNDQYGFDDLGLSADIAIALHAIDKTSPTVAEIAEAVEPKAASDWYQSTYDGVTTTYGGSVAKAAVLAHAGGKDMMSYDGVNLVTLLEGLVADSGPAKGRVGNENDSYGDANVIGQAYTVEALHTAGSDEADAALDYLADQQCPSGFFRLDFTKSTTAADQTCKGGRASGASDPNADVTAIALLALLPQADNSTRAARAIGRGEAWLMSRQAADGSFGGGATTEAANVNSTGLAGWALGELGDVRAAEQAAIWVRRHQVAPITSCPTKLDSQQGAVAYDGSTLAAGRKNGITVASQDQWRRAGAQSIPVLQWAPAGAAHLKVKATKGYVRAGKAVKVSISGVGAGTTVCLIGGGHQVLASAGQDGLVGTRVTAPAGTARRSLTVTDGTATAATSIDVLGAKKLHPKLTKKFVKRTKAAKVVVKGLAPRETVRIRWHGHVVAKGTAGKGGNFIADFRVGKKLGSAKVKVTGQFGAIRHGYATVRVVG